MTNIKMLYYDRVDEFINELMLIQHANEKSVIIVPIGII